MSTASGERRARLAESRKPLKALPLNELWELPGRPHVVYKLASYADNNNPAEAAARARNDLPFLFKAFETGQIGPKRMAKMHGGKPRMSTIHEYLDWTITAQEAQEDDELDFGGFRILLLMPRYVSHYPVPGHPGNVEDKRNPAILGARRPSMPFLQEHHNRPLSAATIRSGPGYLEIPFVATHEGKRGRGYCRCLLEAMEDVARYLGLPKLLLCSTNDPVVKSTWHHLGFDFTTEEQMKEWDTPHSDLVYLQNTTQMHKTVPGMGVYRPVIIKQGEFKQRVYARLDPQPKRPRLYIPPPKKAPPKKVSHMPFSSFNSLQPSSTQAPRLQQAARPAKSAATTGTVGDDTASERRLSVGTQSPSHSMMSQLGSQVMNGAPNGLSNGARSGPAKGPGMELGGVGLPLHAAVLLPGEEHTSSVPPHVLASGNPSPRSSTPALPHALASDRVATPAPMVPVDQGSALQPPLLALPNGPLPASPHLAQSPLQAPVQPMIPVDTRAMLPGSIPGHGSLGLGADGGRASPALGLRPGHMEPPPRELTPPPGAQQHSSSAAWHDRTTTLDGLGISPSLLDPQPLLPANKPAYPTTSSGPPPLLQPSRLSVSSAPPMRVPSPQPGYVPAQHATSLPGRGVMFPGPISQQQGPTGPGFVPASALGTMATTGPPTLGMIPTPGGPGVTSALSAPPPPMIQLPPVSLRGQGPL